MTLNLIRVIGLRMATGNGTLPLEYCPHVGADENRGKQALYVYDDKKKMENFGKLWVTSQQ
ncbi:hypothetical protein BV372_11945 [Nostoc sp. T09]|nr:hypothetical protein BV372_11945 [Nostoc sp. T09]